MATYKVRDKQTGKTYTIREKETFGGFKGGESRGRGASGEWQPTSFLPKFSETEEKIASRPSGAETLTKELKTPFDFKNKPFESYMKPSVTIGKAMAVPFKGAESALANVGMKLQEGKAHPFGLAKAAFQGATGERVGELGDIPRRLGWGEPASSLVGLFSSMGIANLASKGKLVQSAKKGEKFLASKVPKVMNKNYTINRAKLASDGLDDLYQGLSKEYDNLYDKIGELQIGPEDQKAISDIISELPEVIIRRIAKDKNLIRSNGGVSPTLQNLKVLKGIIRKSVPDKIWSGKMIGDINTATLEQTHGKISQAMARNQPDLVALNQKYAEFRRMQKTLGRILYDADGNVKAKGLEGLFKSGAERSKQQFFEKFAEQWPKAQQIAKDIVKFNRRQTMKRWGARIGLVGGGYELGRRAIFNPLSNMFGDSGGGGGYE